MPTNRRTDSDYTQLSGTVPKLLAKNFKQLAIELDLGQSEALEQAIQEWCHRTVETLGAKND